MDKELKRWQTDVDNQELIPGQIVLVIEKRSPYTDGWDNDWNIAMDNYIGHMFRIAKDISDKGVALDTTCECCHKKREPKAPTVSGYFRFPSKGIRIIHNITTDQKEALLHQNDDIEDLIL